MRSLIVNADGYGFTEGISRSIEECIDFGTVRSLSANVNFPRAEGLRELVRRHPDLSVGCHLNPIVGCPLLPPDEVPSLVNEQGEFFYKDFRRRFTWGLIYLDHLRAELMAQIELTRKLVGENFTHVDFHMALHKLPRLYPLFLEVALASGVGRIRTHKYLSWIHCPRQRLRHVFHLALSPVRLSKYAYNLVLRRQARVRGLAMPDAQVEITGMNTRPELIDVENYVSLLANLPDGCYEFVAHPAYVDDELQRWSTYIHQREHEHEVLMSPRFRDAFAARDVRLAGYRDIPIANNRGRAR
jgi:predicted glycoside hydrolase/deacetylase ChbG (UPF0249 family)